MDRKNSVNEKREKIKRVSGVGDKSRAKEIDVSMAFHVARWQSDFRRLPGISPKECLRVNNKSGESSCI